MRNVWKDFRGLLPASPLLVVQVVQHNVDGTSLVELPTGDTFSVRGQGVAEGGFAYVRDGAIEGESPAVFPIVLEV